MPVDLTTIFKGYRMPPGVWHTTITDGWTKPSLVRTVTLTDSSSSTETLLSVNPHSSFCYKNEGFTSAFLRFLVVRIEGLWTFTRSRMARPGSNGPMPETPADLTGHEQIGFRNKGTGQIDNWRFMSPVDGKAVRYVPRPKYVFDDGAAACRAVLELFATSIPQASPATPLAFPFRHRPRAKPRTFLTHGHHDHAIEETVG